ncbi:MAG: hypothetical protein P4L33_22050 [Capsulimonadaceae bacterium]|nr:hypothetical protein [Capsulimonadaceae bacterium]
MTHIVPEVEIVHVDLDSIDDDEENAEAIQFDMVLSAHPTARWIEEFDILYQRRPFSIKPPVNVIQDRLRVHFLPRYTTELQSFIDFLDGVVRQATDEARQTEQIKTHEEQEKKKKEFREVLARVLTSHKH